MQAADQVLEINDIDALDAYARPWRALLCKTHNASFFHTLDWLKAYWAHYGDDQRLRVFVVCHDGRPVGIVPLIVRWEDKRFAKVRVLTYPLHDWGSFYGPIGADPQRLLAAALIHVRDTPRDWDLLDLRWITGDTDTEGNAVPDSIVADVAQTASALESAGYGVRQHLWKRTAVVDTTGNWEDYLASRSQKFRGSIRRYERRLSELGNLEFLRYRPRGSADGDDDARWEDYDQCVALAQRSWQGSSSDGTTLSHDTVADFLRDAHVAAVGCGCLDLNLLRLDGRLIAFAYNYHCDGFVTGLRIGYDPEFAKVGAGKVLWARSFQDSFDRDDRLYEIGSESMSVKRNWLTHIVPVCAFAYYPPLVPKTQLLRLGHWMKDLHHDYQSPWPAH